MSLPDMTGVVERFKALAHPARLRILAMLRDGELCVCQIKATLALAPSTVSAHLSDLRRTGLLEERKVGRWVHYGLARNPDTDHFLSGLWPRLESDAQVKADRAVVDALRKIPVDELCRANLDLGELRLHLPTTGGKRRGTRK
jgi:ArsR family transcriptional regulator